MSLILSIETATKVCSIALHENGTLIGSQELRVDKSHSKFLAPMIRDLFLKLRKEMKELSAVALSKGPGSYTGLRIGSSTAKGICYALDIPLITVNTLLSMCYLANQVNDNGFHLCPMLDARRMEVYALIVDKDLKILQDTKAVVMEESSFKNYLDRFPILFFGDGMYKSKEILEKHPNAHFRENISPLAKAIGYLALEKYQNKDFENLEDFEPFYLKDFITTIPKKFF